MSNLCCRLCTLCCNEDNISDANLQVDNQHDEVVNILHAGANGCTKHYRHGEYVTVDAFNATILGLLHASPTWNDIVLNKDRMARLSGDVPYQSIVKISVPHPEPDKRYVGTGFVFRGFGNDTNLYVITNAHVFQGGEITGSVIFNYDSDTAHIDNADMNGSFSFISDAIKQTKLDEDIFARMAATGDGFAQLYFVNSAGTEMEVPQSFFIRDITNVRDIRNIETVRPGLHFFVLLWTNSYEFGYAGVMSKLIKQQQWAIQGPHVWENVEH